MRLVPVSEQCPPDICQRWSRGHHGPETIPSRPAGHSSHLLVGWGCSSLPVGLRAKSQSQGCLITSMGSWTSHPCNSERNLGFPLGHGVSLWPQDIIAMTVFVLQFKVLEMTEGYVARSVFVAQIECACCTHRGVPWNMGRRTWEALWRVVFSGIAEDGGRQMWYHLNHSGLWKWSLGEQTSFFLQHIHYHMLTPLLCQSAALVGFSDVDPAIPALPLPPPPVIQAAADTQTHSRHTGQGSPQRSVLWARAMALMGNTNLTSGLCCWHSQQQLGLLPALISLQLWVNCLLE